MAQNPVQDPALDQPYHVDRHDAPPQADKLTTKPSKLDARDYLAESPRGIILPPAYVLSQCAEPYDQGQLGSCTANGMCGMLKTEYLLAGKPPPDPSRLFLYYSEREQEGTVSADAGAQPRDGLLILKNSGVARESLWPYDVSRFTDKPASAAYDDATNDKIRGFYRVPGLIGVKAALFAGHHPVGLGMLVFSGMQRSRNGVIPMPDVGEQPAGGHFLYIRGYQDRSDWPGGGYLVLRNSWGEQAGLSGDFLLPYQFAGNTQLVWEFWMIRLP